MITSRDLLRCVKITYELFELHIHARKEIRNTYRAVSTESRNWYKISIMHTNVLEKGVDQLFILRPVETEIYAK